MVKLPGFNHQHQKERKIVWIESLSLLLRMDLPFWGKWIKLFWQAAGILRKGHLYHSLKDPFGRWQLNLDSRVPEKFPNQKSVGAQILHSSLLPRDFDGLLAGLSATQLTTRVWPLLCIQSHAAGRQAHIAVGGQTEHSPRLQKTAFRSQSTRIWP